MAGISIDKRDICIACHARIGHLQLACISVAPSSQSVRGPPLAVCPTVSLSDSAQDARCPAAGLLVPVNVSGRSAQHHSPLCWPNDPLVQSCFASLGSETGRQSHRTVPPSGNARTESYDRDTVPKNSANGRTFPYLKPVDLASRAACILYPVVRLQCLKLSDLSQRCRCSHQFWLFRTAGLGRGCPVLPMAPPISHRSLFIHPLSRGIRLDGHGMLKNCILSSNKLHTTDSFIQCCWQQQKPARPARGTLTAERPDPSSHGAPCDGQGGEMRR